MTSVRSSLLVGLSLTACTVAAEAPELESQADEIRVGVFGTAGESLNVRARPTTGSERVATLPANASAEIECQVRGELVAGTDVWDYLPAQKGYVSDAYLWTGYDGFVPGVPRCAADDGGADAGDDGYYLPLSCGETALVSQARGGFSHTGAAYYAYDFGLALDTPLVAARAGIVSLVRNDVGPGNACYRNGPQSCANTVNYVVVEHADGTDTAYLHVDAVLVRVGDAVTRGQPVALSGATGWSTGPHAHVQRQERCGIWWCQSLPLVFEDVPGGQPEAGTSVTSNNCNPRNEP